MGSKLRKNLKLSKLPQNLFDAEYVAGFLGISINALYLRMHFENFPKALKINGKLYFNLNEVLASFKQKEENEAFCYIVRDEIRTLVDLGKIERKSLGKAIGAKNETVAGGGIYSRDIGFDRAVFLESFFEKQKMPLDIDKKTPFSIQKQERQKYSIEMWEILEGLLSQKKIDLPFISKSLNPSNDNNVGRSIMKFTPSYKVAKLLKLKLLQKNII